MKDCAITQEFINYLTFEKHFSAHTAKCYGADLEQFGDFLTGHSGNRGGMDNSFSPQPEQWRCGDVAVRRRRSISARCS